jgi:hypothetical protein
MKKMIAGAALVATLVGSATPVLAETAATAAQTTSAEATSAQTTSAQATSAQDATGTATTAESSAAPAATTNSTGEAQSTTTEAQSSTTEAPATTTEAQSSTAGAPSTAEEAPAADAGLPNAGLTPDKLFYFLKLWIEQVQLTLTRDAAARAALLEKQAQTRLAEAVEMANAGKADLAQKAMAEAQTKLAAASKEIKAASESGKDLQKLVAQVEADQTRFAKAVSAIVAKVPDEVKQEIEPATADLLVQVAATGDAATKDETPAQEAEQAAAESGLEAELSALQPRTVLVLKAMADASGKDLADLYAMYRQNPGLGRIAKELGLKMGPVQHAAQIEWKRAKGEVELKIEAEKQEEGHKKEEAHEKDEDKNLQATVKSATGLSLKVEKADDDDKDEHEKHEKGEKHEQKESKSKEQKDHGHGNGKGRGGKD